MGASFSFPAIRSGDPNEDLLLLELVYVEHDAGIDDQIALGIHEYLEPVERPRRGPGEIEAVRMKLAPMTRALEDAQSGKPVDRAPEVGAAREQRIDARTLANDKKAVLRFPSGFDVNDAVCVGVRARREIINRPYLVGARWMEND